jgi:hypothetical protein
MRAACIAAVLCLSAFAPQTAGIQDLAPAVDPQMPGLLSIYRNLHEHPELSHQEQQTSSFLAGAMRQAVPDDISADAMHHPPRSTRASIRGKCVQKFGAAVTSAQWDHIVVESKNGPLKISLLDLFAPEQILHYNAVVDAARTPEDLQPLAGGPR